MSARDVHQENAKELGSMCKRLNRTTAVIIFVAIRLVPAVQPVQGATWHLTVRGGDADLGETPVIAEMKAAIPVGSYIVELAGTSGWDYAAQVFENDGRRELAVVLPSIAAHRKVSYALKPASPGDAPFSSGLSFEPVGRNLRLKLGQQLLTEYYLKPGNKPFFFPLVGPTGESYTRSYPLSNIPDEDHDHPHQRSCWFTHGNVNGVDFWSEGTRFGTITESGRKVIAAGPVAARLSTTNQWRAADGRKVCDDERSVTFYRTKSARIVDFEFRIIASNGPVTFHDTKEGTFGLRVASSMDAAKKTGGKITNADGLTDEKAWGKASPWVDYIGPVKGKLVGIAIINHPRSFRYPTTWHVRPYGLFAANPFGWHDFGRTENGDYTISGGQALEFAYRVVLHEGNTQSVNVPALAAGYSKPPEIEIEKD
jgi:hypothetical protein